MSLFNEGTFVVEPLSVWLTHIHVARVAQSVEHQAFNLRVLGSSPSAGEIIFLVMSVNFGRCMKMVHSTLRLLKLATNHELDNYIFWTIYFVHVFWVSVCNKLFSHHVMQTKTV